MKAIIIEGEDLLWREMSEPTPGPGEVKIAVYSTAVNRADLVQRQGGYPPPPGASPIMGLECAGEITMLGSGVTRFKLGDQVCALLAGGGYAETVIVPAGQVLPIPKGLDLHSAAAIPEVFATAYLNLYMEAKLSAGEHVLLHAGASGVGTAAIQLCRRSLNPVFVTVGNKVKLDACLKMGAAAGHNRHDGGFADFVSNSSAAGGVDVILDPVGGNYLAENLQVLNTDGRLILIGLMGGAKSSINLGLMLMKRIRLVGSTLRARSIPYKSRIMDGLFRQVWPGFVDGSLRPCIDKTFAIEDVSAAHAYMSSDANIGKILLRVR